MEEDTTTMLLGPEDYIPEEKLIEFAQELRKVINKHGLQQYCNTPDFILAETLVGYFEVHCLSARMADKYNSKGE